MTRPTLSIKPSISLSSTQPRRFRLVALLALTLFVSACVTPVSRDDWPSNLPDRQIFVEAWKQQLRGGTVSSNLDEHLIWIVRFYEGSVIYPIGWNDMTESVLESLDDPATKRSIEQRLGELGLAISVEWAQNNGSRKIDSNAVAVWGNALRTAVEQGEQVGFVGKIEDDVTRLLNGEIEVNEIERERYYPAQDYDNF